MGAALNFSPIPDGRIVTSISITAVKILVRKGPFVKIQWSYDRAGTVNVSLWLMCGCGCDQSG